MCRNTTIDRGVPVVSSGSSFLPPAVTVTLPPGAMLGDATGSFLKRRTGRERGAPFPVVDQFGFLASVLLLSLPVEPARVTRTFTPPVLLVVVVLTPLLHLGTKVIAYLLGLKDGPR